jgi:hypothetical protein
VVAEEIVYHEIAVEAARRAAPFREFVRNVPNDYLRRSTLRRLLRQISQRLDKKDRANHRHEEVIKPDRFVHADRLKE